MSLGCAEQLKRYVLWLKLEYVLRLYMPGYVLWLRAYLEAIQARVYLMA